MFEPKDGNYDLFEAVISNVMELYAGDTTYYEDAELIKAIQQDLECIKVRLDDRDSDVSAYRRRALEAEIKVRRLENKLAAYETKEES